MRKTLRERFDEKWIPEPNSGCWLWTASCNQDGYGMLKLEGKMIGAHRISKLIHSRIPIETTGVGTMNWDHLCKVRCCVNPAHLELVTPQENALRGNGQAGIHARKTHCIRGHELTGTNLAPTRKGTNWRRCRKCKNILRMESYYKRKKRG